MSLHQSIITRNLGKTLVLSSIAFATLSGFTANRYAADFSGEWKLNESKSELGEFGARIAPKTIKITATTEGITTESTGTNFQGETATTSEKLTFDGKETESTVFGASKKKSTAKWADNGETLNVNSTINFEMDGQTTAIKVAETWKLADAGKSMIIEQKSSSSFGDNAMKLVYEKVK